MRQGPEGGSLGIDGAAEAGVHVALDTAPGLTIVAEVALNAEPKFKFDVSGYVAVTRRASACMTTAGRWPRMNWSRTRALG